MKCEICDGDHEYNLFSCVRALAARVAKLEAAQNLAAAVLKSGPRESESRPPEDESGRTAAAVIPPAIPDGFALAPGWHLRHPEDYSECTWGLTAHYNGCQLRHAYQGFDGKMACPVHAVRMRALVPLVPAEPSGTSGELHHCSHDGCDRNGARCGYDDRWWCDPHWNGTAPAPQPEAPAGFKVVGRSGPGVPHPSVGTWILLARDTDGTAFAPTSGPYMPVYEAQDRPWPYWDAGCYDILEPLPAEPPAPSTCPCPSECEEQEHCQGRCDPDFPSRAQEESMLPAEPPSYWACACGYMNNGPVCTKCGKSPAERPAPEVACHSLCNRPMGHDGRCCSQRRHQDGICPVCEPPAPSEPARRPPRISDEEMEKRRPWPHPAVLMNAMEPDKAPLSERLRSYSSAATLPHWRAEIEGLAREAADLEARLAFVTSGLESATNGERLERLRVDDLTARLAAAEEERDEARRQVAEWVSMAGERTAQVDARVAEERARCLVHFDRLGRETKFRDDVREAIASGAPVAPVKP